MKSDTFTLTIPFILFVLDTKSVLSVVRGLLKFIRLLKNAPLRVGLAFIRLHKTIPEVREVL